MIEKLRIWLYRLPLVEQLGIQLLFGLLVGLLCIVVFAVIADDVIEQDRLAQIDAEFADALHAQATPQSIQTYRIVSWIGMPGAWLIGVAVGLFFLWRVQRLHLTIWIVALLGGLLLNNALKLVFQRARPEFADPFVIETQYSFPSGHAMLALILFGLIAYFGWHVLRDWRLRITAVFVAVIIVVVIGISRMTLGVHYLSDVLAGFAAGGVWLSACITALDTVKRRKRAGDPAAQESTNDASTPGI
jgi:membrane-associated phospholipid phosphatase